MHNVIAVCHIRSLASVSVYCAFECVSVTGLITRIQSHPSLTQRRRVIIPAVPSSVALCPRYRLLWSHGGGVRESAHREPASAAAAELLRWISGEKRTEREGKRVRCFIADCVC